MDNEENIYNNEEVVGVPESIETGQSLKGVRWTQPVSAKPWLSQHIGYCHQDHHDHPCPAFSTLNKPPIVWWPPLTKERLQGFVVSITCMQKPGEVTCQVSQCMQPDSNCNTCRKHLDRKINFINVINIIIIQILSLIRIDSTIESKGSWKQGEAQDRTSWFLIKILVHVQHYLCSFVFLYFKLKALTMA